MKAVRAISIEQWLELAKDGTEIPIQITLDGYSMQPFIRKGQDIVTILPVNRPLRWGEVVLLRRQDGTYIVHRICCVKDDMVQTVGDRCVKKDGPVRKCEVYGLVEYRERNGLNIPLNHGGIRFCGMLWLLLFPLRAPLMRMYAVTSGIFRKITHKEPAE